MAFDAHKNFAYSTVATAPSPATSGTSLVVAAGQGTRFPAVPFNASVWPIGVVPTPANAEVVRVTAIATDTLTITRATETSSARTIIIGDQIAATITAKTLTDVEAGTVPTPQNESGTGALGTVNLTARFTHLRCTGAAPVIDAFTVAGVTPTAGDRVLISCLGTTAKVKHQGTASDAAFCIICPSAAGQIIGLDGMMLLVYDDTTDRWRETLQDPGAPITWTPIDASGAALTFTGVSASYQQWGRRVEVQWALRYPSTADGTSALVGGLPFTIGAQAAFAAGFVSCSIPLYLWGSSSTTTIFPLKQAGGAQLTNAELTLAFLYGAGSYFIS